MTSPATRARTRFALIAFGSLVALFIAGVFVADAIAAFVRPFADAGSQILGLAQSVDPDGKQGWTIAAGERFRPVLRGAQIDTTANLEGQTLRLMLRGFPLFLALMIASPWIGKAPVQALKGLLLLLAIYLLSLLAVINNLMFQSVEQMELAIRQLPPGAVIAIPQGNPAGFFIAKLFNYLALYVLPLIAPVAVWAMLRPDAIRLLMRPAQAEPEPQPPA